ncbi:helix-turn-helix domain-containing protein [Agrococcus sp. ARC_14]|uniref:IclR family transcriptional regulator n=1 Tax=Agrococcus sp. ARC_14 TaxID=2919927 RepID=UPI001F05FACC|nr:helix-turn-helix domain-containing protein [Agrococcus sp. ARC_14]MCH1881342.1 helix-turn-helix domain-containing protein [Agrococcus sp. ARC_14]
MSGGIDIQAVERVGRILALFGPGREGVTSTEAAELIDLNRTTTYRYLASLVAAGVLELRGDRTYGPGPTLLQLGAFAIGRRSVMLHAPEPMAALAQRTGITAVLSQWGTNSPVVSHVEESPGREIVVTVRVGMHLSTQAAQAVVFQAFRSEDPNVQGTLRRMAAAEQRRVQREVEVIREQGFAGRVSERGIAVLAVPIHDDRQMVASLGLLATRDVLDVSSASPELTSLQETAAGISTALGFTAEA